MLKKSKKVENTATARKKSAFSTTIVKDIQRKKAKKNKNGKQWINLTKVDESDCKFKRYSREKVQKKLKYSNREMIR